MSVFQLEKLITKNYYLHKSAKDGYRSYLQAYASHQHRDIFNVNTLDLLKVAKAYGFQVPPAVNLGILLIIEIRVKITRLWLAFCALFVTLGFGSGHPNTETIK